MIVFGSGTIVSELTKHGLVDEYQFVVSPLLPESDAVEVDEGGGELGAVAGSGGRERAPAERLRRQRSHGLSRPAARRARIAPAGAGHDRGVPAGDFARPGLRARLCRPDDGLSVHGAQRSRSGRGVSPGQGHGGASLTARPQLGRGKHGSRPRTAVARVGVEGVRSGAATRGRAQSEFRRRTFQPCAPARADRAIRRRPGGSAAGTRPRPAVAADERAGRRFPQRRRRAGNCSARWNWSPTSGSRCWCAAVSRWIVATPLPRSPT